MTFPATWTPERDADLKRLRAEGVSVSKIGEALGVSRNAIAGRLFRLGLTEPSKNPIKPRTAPRPERHVGAQKKPRPSSVRMIDLTNSQCRWPLWNSKDGAPEFWSCGHALADGSRSYCAAHLAVAYRQKTGTPTEKVRQKIAKMYLSGATKDYIAAEVAFPRSTVLQTLFETGLIRNRAMAGL